MEDEEEQPTTYYLTVRGRFDGATRTVEVKNALFNEVIREARRICPNRGRVEIRKTNDRSTEPDRVIRQ